MREQRAGRNVDGIGALAFAPLRDLDGVGEHIAFLFPRNDIVAVDRAEFDLQMEIAADARADRTDHFQQEARAVLQRSAVFVGAIIDPGREKLREQVTVGRMQLDAVETGFARPPGAVGKSGHEVLDLRLAGGAAEKTVQRFLAAGGAQCRAVGIVHPRDIHLPAGVAELHDVFAVEPVHGRTQPLPQRNEIVAMDGGIAGDDASLHQHRHVGGDDRADAAGGEFALPVDAGLRERAVLVVELAGNVRPEDAVLDRQIAEPQRREDDVLGHGLALVPSSASARSHTARNKAGTKAAAGHCAQFPAMN